MGEVIRGKFGQSPALANRVAETATAEDWNAPMEYDMRTVRLAATALHVAGKHIEAERLDTACRSSGYPQWVLLGGEMRRLVETADLVGAIARQG